MLIKLTDVTASELNSLHDYLESKANRVPEEKKVWDVQMKQFFASLQEVKGENRGLMPRYVVEIEIAEKYTVDGSHPSKDLVPLEALARLLQSIGRFPGSCTAA